MKLIGVHVSIGGGVFNAPLNAQAIGCTAFGMFTKNQRQWKAAPYDDAAVRRFTETMRETGFNGRTVLAHDGYLINLGNPEKAAREKSLEAFIDELERCSALGIGLLNMHPGSHLGAMTDEKCLDIIADGINRALSKTAGVTVVVENTAGQGSNVGHRFEHLRRIIDRVEDRSRIGVCLDTCHSFAAGYDLRGPGEYAAVMAAFGEIVGFEFLKGAHLNDAVAALGSRKDRHAPIGNGELGTGAFENLMNDPRFDAIPLILETPVEERWPEEIRLLRSLEKKTDRKA